jgi:beta-glucosidase
VTTTEKALTDEPVRLPAGFLLGAGTSAYQIEGAVAEDGRGPSIWDTFSHSPGRVHGGDTGDTATDHYHRWEQDVALMAELGLSAYRFSVAWPRIRPGGGGPVNQRGLDFYSRLVDCLLEHGIEPWPTLYHWDLPQPLEDAGGWPVRDTAYRFAEYAAIVHEALGDRVRCFTTLNEPWCSAFLGYASGDHAPGRREPLASVRAVHHLLLGHGLATRAIRSADPETKVGITLNLYAVSPAGDDPADQDAVRRIDGMQNRLFLDPVLHGRYPEDVLTDLAPITDFAHVEDGDLDIIGGARPDLLGVNYYSRYLVASPNGERGESLAFPGSEEVRLLTRGKDVTSMGWDIDADGLVEVLLRLHREYPALPLYVTENGAAFEDKVESDGRIHDERRVTYLDQHLRACRRAADAGVPIQGYFAWSLLDNFELAWGYSQRFGLYYVDYDSQRRLPKDSALWYGEVLRRHRAD